MFKDKLSAKLINKNQSQLDEKVISMIDYVDQVNDLIKRTHVAMGRTVKFNTQSSSSVNGSINATNITSTH